MAGEKSENNQARDKKNPFWEWVISAIGLILVVGAVGATFYRAAFKESSPPNLSVTSESVQPSGDGFIVRFRVKNTGSQTASAVNIEGELKSGGETIETASATLSYAPAHSERHGGLYFTKNPQQFDLQIRATGYQNP